MYMIVRQLLVRRGDPACFLFSHHSIAGQFSRNYPSCPRGNRVGGFLAILFFRLLSVGPIVFPLAMVTGEYIKCVRKHCRLCSVGAEPYATQLSSEPMLSATAVPKEFDGAWWHGLHDGSCAALCPEATPARHSSSSPRNQVDRETSHRRCNTRRRFWRVVRLPRRLYCNGHSHGLQPHCDGFLARTSLMAASLPRSTWGSPTEGFGPSGHCFILLIPAMLGEWFHFRSCGWSWQCTRAWTLHPSRTQNPSTFVARLVPRQFLES